MKFRRTAIQKALPELARQTLSWTFKELNINERLVFLRMMEQVMPPDPFKGLVAALSTLIPATE
jgi:hypothetical protein